MTLRTSNGGNTWSTKTLPITEAQYLGSVLCQSGTVCQAAGTKQAGPLVIRTTNGGVSWKPETMPLNLSDGDITSLSCPSASVCTAIDPNGFMRTTDSGTKWSQEALIAGVSSPNVLSCPSASTCVAAATGSAGPVSLHTTDAGVKWVSEAFPTGLSQLDAITCRSTSVCEGGGVGGAVRTTNGGASWAEQPIGAYDAYAIDAIACSSIAVCEAGEGTASSVLSHDERRDNLGRRYHLPSKSWACAVQRHGLSNGLVLPRHHVPGGIECRPPHHGRREDMGERGVSAGGEGDPYRACMPVRLGLRGRWRGRLHERRCGGHSHYGRWAEMDRRCEVPVEYCRANRRSVPNDYDMRGCGFELHVHQRLHRAGVPGLSHLPGGKRLRLQTVVPLRSPDHRWRSEMGGHEAPDQHRLSLCDRVPDSLGLRGGRSACPRCYGSFREPRSGGRPLDRWRDDVG
jgi:hypothetical protein